MFDMKTPNIIVVLIIEVFCALSLISKAKNLLSKRCCLKEVKKSDTKPLVPALAERAFAHLKEQSLC
jgi:hypothetical protein